MNVAGVAGPLSPHALVCDFGLGPTSRAEGAPLSKTADTEDRSDRFSTDPGRERLGTYIEQSVDPAAGLRCHAGVSVDRGQSSRGVRSGVRIAAMARRRSA